VHHLYNDTWLTNIAYTLYNPLYNRLYTTGCKV